MPKPSPRTSKGSVAKVRSSRTILPQAAEASGERVDTWSHTTSQVPSAELKAAAGSEFCAPRGDEARSREGGLVRGQRGDGEEEAGQRHREMKSPPSHGIAPFPNRSRAGGSTRGAPASGGRSRREDSPAGSTSRNGP